MCAVIELGAGTGVVTRALLARGIPEDELTLVEQAPEFARVLAMRFLAARVLQLDAARLTDPARCAGWRARGCGGKRLAVAADHA